MCKEILPVTVALLSVFVSTVKINFFKSKQYKNNTLPDIETSVEVPIDVVSKIIKWQEYYSNR